MAFRFLHENIWAIKMKSIHWKLGQKAAGQPAAISRSKCNMRNFMLSLWNLGMWDLSFLIKHLLTTLLCIVHFSVGWCFYSSAKEKFSSEQYPYELQCFTRAMPFSASIMVMNIILSGIPHDCSQRTSPALGAMIHPCRLKPAYPLSNQTWTHPLSARETCWMDIIVHCWGFHHCNPPTKCRHS